MEEQDRDEDRTRIRASPIPTTFGGVAALACGPVRWLLSWQAFTATAIGAALTLVLLLTWARDIEQAIADVGTAGEIRDGRFYPSTPKSWLVRNSSFLGIAVVGDPADEPISAADVNLWIEPEGWSMHSLFGRLDGRYPATLRASVDRVEMSGLWSAWKAPILLTFGLATTIGVLMTWVLLATVYSPVLRLVSGFLNRDVGLGDCWKLAAAALLPGALLMTGAFGLYATHQLALVGLLLASPLHILVGWIYCLGGVWRLPKIVSGPNPFIPPMPEETDRPVERSNPFRSS
ncbi:MAG: hypothetical protein JNK85_01195 [Verrucomicrobiales bacterium]|nr:hypothetical protein [Verrucomicrobiales bacterium]